MRKCIVKSNTYSDSYLCSNVSYNGSLFRAKIFDGENLPEHILEGGDELIFLDSKKGLELLTKEIEFLNTQIPQEEARLEEMKKGREALYNASSKRISKYIELYNKRNNRLIGISSEAKEKIIEEIIEEGK